MLRIGDVASKHGLTLRALRFYEDKGLIAPTRKGTTRLYSEADDARIGLVTRWTRAGFSLDEVRQLLAVF